MDLNVSHQYVDDNRLYGHRGYRAMGHRYLQLFRHVGRLKSKIMLQIRDGEGLFPLRALANGVEKAILFEPEADRFILTMIKS